MRKNLISGLSALLLVGCLTAPPEQAMSSKGPEAAIAEAEEALGMAKKAGAEWMVIDSATGGRAQPLTKLLEVAKEKAAAGEADEAARLAGRVTELSRIGIEQIESQAGAGPVYN